MMIFENLRSELTEKSILITGGSGFFGKNLYEALRPFGMKIYVLARNPIVQEGIHFIEQDVTKPFNFDLKVDYIIHAATPAVEAGDKAFEKTLDIIVNGTKNALDFAEKINCAKFLLVSSGAVYGEQPEDLAKIPETYVIKESFFDFKSAYGTGKRISELLALDWAHRTKQNLTIARCFAFSGHHLPLNQHFAIGNFVRDALTEKTIQVRGDGSALRSYMDADDLVVWIMTILLRGESGQAYNVGSDQEISIKDLAQKIAEHVPGTKVEIQNNQCVSNKRSKYIPSTEKARTKLNLNLNIAVDLDTSIQKMLDFNKG